MPYAESKSQHLNDSMHSIENCKRKMAFFSHAKKKKMFFLVSTFCCLPWIRSSNHSEYIEYGVGWMHFIRLNVFRSRIYGEKFPARVDFVNRLNIRKNPMKSVCLGFLKKYARILYFFPSRWKETHRLRCNKTYQIEIDLLLFHSILTFDFCGRIQCV